MKKFRGISLIETLISLTIVGISLIALIPVVTVRQEANDFSATGNAFFTETTGNNPNYFEPSAANTRISIGAASEPETPNNTDLNFRVFNRGIKNSGLIPVHVDDRLFWNNEDIEADNNIHFRTQVIANSTPYSLRRLFIDNNRVRIDNDNNLDPYGGNLIPDDNLTSCGIRNSANYYSIRNNNEEYLAVDVANNVVGIGRNAATFYQHDDFVGIFNGDTRFDVQPEQAVAVPNLTFALGLKNSNNPDAGSNYSNITNDFAIYRWQFNANEPLVLNDNVSAYSYTARRILISSDARLKNVLGSYDKGLDYICKINPKEFTFKNDSQNKLQVGVIAQELKKIFPEAVKTNQKTGYLMVSTDPILYALVNSVKELNKKNLEIEQENKLLEEKIIKLRAIRDKIKATTGGDNV